MVLPIGALSPVSIKPAVDPAATTNAGSSKGGFGKLLSDSIGKLEQSQTDAAQQTQALATGQATNMSTVVMSVEQASLEVQLASQIRNKVLDAYNEVFRMQI
jgi:flagellar hook-basal body complex protein FliE